MKETVYGINKFFTLQSLSSDHRMLLLLIVVIRLVRLGGYRDPMEIYRSSYTGLVLLLESTFDKSYYVSPVLYGHSLLQNLVTG
jgi:hypothetical protein